MVNTARRTTRVPNEAGFTLVELLMAMTVGIAIMGSVVGVASQMQRSYYSSLDRAAVQQEGRFALDWIARVLQSAGNNPILITTGPCPATGTTFRAIRRYPNGDGVQNDIRIHTDLNGNGLLGGATSLTCTEAGEDITIGLDTTTGMIMRRDNNTEGSSSAMTDAVITGLTFTYLDGNRAATASDAAVCFIQISVTSRTATFNINRGERSSYTNTAEVRVRTR